MAALFYWLDDRFPDLLSAVTDRLNPASYILFAALIALSAVLYRRSREYPVYRHMGLATAGLALIFAVADIAYEPDQRETRIPISDSGHMVVEARVDGVPVVFLVDTGSNKVVLSPKDAECVGFDHSELRFDQAQRTAAGTIHGAPVTLNSIVVGDIDVRDVDATVNGRSMDISLLGMSFLGQLTGFEVSEGELILRH